MIPEGFLKLAAVPVPSVEPELDEPAAGPARVVTTPEDITILRIL